MPTPQFSPPPILISVEQAALLAGVGRTMLYTLMASNAVRSVRVGRRRLVEYKSLKSWQASLVANEGLRSTEVSQ